MERPATTRRRRALLRRARGVIRSRFADPDLDLSDVAEAIGSSPRQLQRASGEAFRSYLLRVRMTEAKRLITREPNPLPVRIACRRVGYRQASGLRQAFVRFYGYNPSAIQKRHPEYLGSETFPAEGGALADESD